MQKSFIVNFRLGFKYTSVIGKNLLPHWLSLPSNNESIVCSCQSVFWCFASCDRKKQPPKEVNNAFKHFSKFTQKYLCGVSTYQLNPLHDFLFFGIPFFSGYFDINEYFLQHILKSNLNHKYYWDIIKKHMSVYLKCLHYHIFIVFLCLMLKRCKYTQKYMKIWKKINSCKTYFPYLN